jgi:hypothetical protein
LVEGGPAQLAGLMLGDTLTGRVGYYNGDPSRDATIEVKRAGETLVITYRPAATRRVVYIDPTPSTFARLDFLRRAPGRAAR